MNEKIKKLKEIIDGTDNLVFFGGAGVSTESGIPDFRSTVVTQNIDGLHQMAGSKNVLELHGSIHRNYCMRCGKFFDAAYVKNSEGAPKCDECGGLIKPDVVLYEEGLDENVISKTIHYISQADVLIIGGTSLVVYPAAGLIDYFKGSHLILINKSATQRDSQADLVINDKIGEVFGQL